MRNQSLVTRVVFFEIAMVQLQSYVWLGYLLFDYTMDKFLRGLFPQMTMIICIGQSLLNKLHFACFFVGFHQIENTSTTILKLAEHNGAGNKKALKCYAPEQDRQTAKHVLNL
jgi:hypothetical protein